MSLIYHRRVDPEPVLESGSVVAAQGGKQAVFKCPCGERIVFLRQTPHVISFREDGRLHVDPSIGSRKDEKISGEKRPANWCHLWIKEGVPQMHDDAGCKGATS